MFLTNIIITESLIIDSIKELSSNSAAGPDGIPASLAIVELCLRISTIPLEPV